jgi:hypothetical protein
MVTLPSSKDLGDSYLQHTKLHMLLASAVRKFRRSKTTTFMAFPGRKSDVSWSGHFLSGITSQMAQNASETITFPGLVWLPKTKGPHDFGICLMQLPFPLVGAPVGFACTTASLFSLILSRAVICSEFHLNSCETSQDRIAK